MIEVKKTLYQNRKCKLEIINEEKIHVFSTIMFRKWTTSS